MPVKGFKEFLAEVEADRAAGNLHERVAVYHFATVDLIASAILTSLLMEALPRVDLGKGRSIMFHKAHVPGTEDHLHFLVKGSKIAAINKSGAAHDRSQGVELQKWAINGARQHYPDFNIPDDGLIEQLYSDDQARLLVESANGQNDRVARAAQLLAVTRAIEVLRQ